MENTMLFTPFAFPGTRMRAHLTISEDDMARFDALPRESEDSIDVFDETSQTFYRVTRADCGGHCRCAAVVIGEGDSFVWQKQADEYGAKPVDGVES